MVVLDDFSQLLACQTVAQSFNILSHHYMEILASTKFSLEVKKVFFAFAWLIIIYLSITFIFLYDIPTEIVMKVTDIS